MLDFRAYILCAFNTQTNSSLLLCNGDLNTADGSGVRGRNGYNLINGLTLGINYSYDQAFESRVSGDIKYRFGTNGYGILSMRSNVPPVMPVIQVISTKPSNRDVRVQDGAGNKQPTEKEKPEA